MTSEGDAGDSAAADDAADGPARPRGPRPAVWRVHLGAHKTATTHLQNALAERRRALRKAGVEYLPLQTVRDANLPGLWRTLKAEEAPRRERRRRLMQTLRPLARGSETMAFSEENLLGGAQALLRVPPYPTAGPIVRFLCRLADRGETLKLFLSVRSWEAVLPSAYAQAIRHRHTPGGFDAVRARVSEAPPRWSGLVDAIRRSAPQAELTVWRYEDYAAHAREAATLFLGVDPGPLDAAARPSGTATPSAAAVREAEALPAELSGQARMAAVRAIYERLPAGPSEKFAPFSEADRARLRAVYAEDLAAIEAAHPGVLVRWD